VFTEMKTCFKKVDYDLAGLLHYIEIGDIGLPDIQRPFVWSNAKVRDLFDSMYRGFPVGYLLFWANAAATGAKQIGMAGKQHVPSLLIVDGQQRLTSLYAVFRGKKVLDEDFRERQIEIAFRPRDGKFEVTDAAIRKDPEFIANISELWANGGTSYQIVKKFLDGLGAKTPLTQEEETAMSRNLDRLFDLLKYPFTALEIAPTVDEEQVADIFVRINSEGVKLNQADFILTLLSVFWDEGRKELEEFSRRCRQVPGPESGPTPFNYFIYPGPDQMLRSAIALGFFRGRLKYVYQILRGKDLETGQFSPERREEQFAALKGAQAETLDLTNWHEFLKCLLGAGFRSGEMITSQNALLYAYAFYLIGRNRFGLNHGDLRRPIGRWFFFTALTGRYTSSPETVMDGDLNRIAVAKTAQDFLALLHQEIAAELTNDFWAITLPAALDSSSARSPELFAFIAAQNRLNAPVLYSAKTVPELLDPAIKAAKKAIERHHLFPRAWLESALGITDLKVVNQIANLTLLEWPDNVEISDDPPSEYVPRCRERWLPGQPEEWRRMHDLHALPDRWESLSFEEFLLERRGLMAGVIRRGFEAI